MYHIVLYIISDPEASTEMNVYLVNKSYLSTNLSENDCSLPFAHGVSLIAVNATVGLFGTLGNLLVCVAVASNPCLRRSSNFLLVSLAIADLIVTMVCEPLFLVILVDRTNYNSCAWKVEFVFALLSNLSASVSVSHMAAISIDRLLAVIYPLRHKSIMETFGLKALLIISWTSVAAIFALVQGIPDVSVTVRLRINLVAFTLCYTIVLISYTAIVISLVRQRKLRNQLRNGSSNNPTPRRMELRVTFTLAIVIIVFTACWFPLFAIFAAAGKLLVKLYGTVHMWVRSVTLSNSAMNFLIYGSRMRNFSDAYTTIFRKAFGFVESHISSLKSLQCKKHLSGCCTQTSHSKQVFGTRL